VRRNTILTVLICFVVAAVGLSNLKAAAQQAPAKPVEQTHGDKLRAEFGKLRASSAVKLFPYEKAEIRPGPTKGTQELVVLGTKHCGQMEIMLVPRLYDGPPESFAIEVVAIPRRVHAGHCQGAFRAPYSATISLGNISDVREVKNIEVVGAEQAQKVAIPR
jgi:hypothetical protein